jgi:hypothetical protein
MLVKNSTCDFNCPRGPLDLKMNAFFVPDKRITLPGATGTLGLCDAPKLFAPLQDLSMMPVPFVSPFSTRAQSTPAQHGRVQLGVIPR